MRRGLGRWAVTVVALVAAATLTACGEEERPVREVAADLPTAAPADQP
ncbi:hypothetical protein NMK34_20785 [Micromonospora sp. BRA006-A]|nr:hypothetical protein [Micromonospora sp. BRA006-A]